MCLIAMSPLRPVPLITSSVLMSGKPYYLFTKDCGSLLFSIITCLDLGLGTDEAEEDFGVWQVKTMVAIIFSMLSEGCSKLTIYTECWNPFLKELAVVLSFLSNLWPWLYLNFLFCHRSCIYWAWNCEIQVWNRSLVSALVTVVYKQRWILCRARKACEYFPMVMWKQVGSWEQHSVLSSHSSADRLWLACWMLCFSPSLKSHCKLNALCSLASVLHGSEAGLSYPGWRNICELSLSQQGWWPVHPTWTELCDASQSGFTCWIECWV